MNMAYKQAVAYMVTKDERYARQAAAIVHAWATGNTVFGLNYRNGPLVSTLHNMITKSVSCVNFSALFNPAGGISTPKANWHCVSWRHHPLAAGTAASLCVYRALVIACM